MTRWATMSADMVVGLASIVLTTAIAIYAIYDARNQVRKQVRLARDLAYLKIKNDMVWEFIEPTESAHTPEIAKGLHEFGLLAQALNSELTADAIKSAVEKEALKFAEELVGSGRATWKSGIDLGKAQTAIESWRTQTNAERVKKIICETKRSFVKHFLFVLLTGLLFAGNLTGGRPFVVPDSAQAVGYDLFSLLVWVLFFWSLTQLIRKGVALVRGGK